MWMFPVLILLTVFFARCISTYDATLVFKKHVIINNLNAAKILIDQSRVNSRTKLLKSNRNKLTISGLIFYIAISLFTLTSIILLFFVSPIESQPYIVDSRRLYLYAETLNQKISVLLFEYLLFAEVVFYFFNTHRSLTPKMRKKAEEKLKQKVDDIATPMQICKKKQWQLVATGVDGNCRLFGVNIFDYKWIDTKEAIELGKPFPYSVYEVIINEKPNRFAAGERSNCVWEFYEYKY